MEHGDLNARRDRQLDTPGVSMAAPELYIYMYIQYMYTVYCQIDWPSWGGHHRVGDVTNMEIYPKREEPDRNLNMATPQK